MNSIKNTKIFILALLCVIFAFAGVGFGQQTADYYAHLKAKHAAAVKKYIGGQTNLRPAQISDCKNKFGLDSFRQNNGQSAHPFYAIADFNKDNFEDFAVVLYDSKQAAKARFTVLIFNGKKSGDYQIAYKSLKTDLQQGGIWTDGFGAQEGKTTLTAGVFETDDAIWIEWSGGGYTAHNAEAEN